MRLLQVISVFLVFLASAARGQAVPPESLPASPNPAHSCRMYGHCNELNGSPMQCPYSGPPRQLIHSGLTPEERDDLIAAFETYCPTFLHDSDGSRLPNDQIFTCCNSEQVTSMVSMFPLAAAVLGRCPTCLRNYARQTCEMSCAPDQGRFLEVYTDMTRTGVEYVTEIDYRIHEDFMYDSHASCSGVIVPQTGLPAINVMCGSAAVCDAESWYGYSGDAVNNPFVSVQTNFLPWPTTEDSMNARALPCNETFNGTLPCSCLDCSSTCPSGNAPIPPQRCTVLTLDCTGFYIGLVVFIVTGTIFVILALVEHHKTKSGRKHEQNSEIPQINKLTSWFSRIFGAIGGFSADNSLLIIMFTSWIAFAMFFGFGELVMTSDRLELWSAPNSKSRQDLNYFNSRFGPFYRASQVFLNFESLGPFVVDNITYGPAFRVEALQELVRLETAIEDIGRAAGNVVLDDVCYAPLRGPGVSPDLSLCVVMSASIYLAETKYNIDNATYLSRIMNCLNNFYGLECLASWGGGAEPEIAFGGYEGDNILQATTLVINYAISNHLLQESLTPVLEWENEFLNLLHDYDQNGKPDYIDVSYGADRSIEDEIERVSRAEAVPIAASYVMMLIYVTLALGKFRSCRTYLVESKVLVAIVSILIVILAIFCAICLLGYSGVTLSLLAVNIIPFFVLSVGVDNVFLMVNTLSDIEINMKSYDDYNENFDFRSKRKFVFKKMMEKVGPSIFVTALTQITCFAIGTTANFPAVQTFAVFVTFSLIFMFIFQITTVVAVLAIDYKRINDKRLDIFFCIRRKILDDVSPLTSATPDRGVIYRFMKRYARVLLNKRVKIAVVILFIAFFSICIMFAPHIEVGLDQEMALPTDSYVYKYLQAVNHLFKLGPPVYFVLKSGLNFTEPSHQDVICGGQMCREDSLATQIFLASQHSDLTYIARPSNSWIDDFFDWSTLRNTCCKYNVEDGSFCASTNTSSVCQFCTIELEPNNIRPVGEDFERYLPFFLQDEPTTQCNKGGLASYYSNVIYELDDDGRAIIQDSNFMAYHTALTTSYDYITAIRYAYEISDNITSAIREHTDQDVEVFAYGVFYPFFEQYLTMWRDTLTSISYSLLGALVIVFLASGFNWLTTVAIIVNAIMNVGEMAGIMYFWNIPLNAVSCINLIVSIGISVEFTSHLAHAFSTSRKQGDERVVDAVRTVGPTIITGITFTNIPIIVLAFSQTQIIEVFFFRMLFSIVIIGLLHGMIFLPVLLSYLNDLTYKPKKET